MQNSNAKKHQFSCWTLAAKLWILSFQSSEFEFKFEMEFEALFQEENLNGESQMVSLLLHNVAVTKSHC